MIDVLICVLLILVLVHASICCGRRKKEGEGDVDTEEKSTTSSSLLKAPEEKSAPSLKLVTCIEDDLLELKATQADDDDNPEVGGRIWEVAGEVEVDAVGGTMLPREPTPEKAKVVEAAVDKKAEADEVKVGKASEKEEKKPVVVSERRKEEDDSRPKEPKKKEPQDMWEAFQKLEETQPDLIEYNSIMSPVPFNKLEQNQDSAKAGSLGDLLNQLMKVKSAKKEKNNKASRQSVPSAKVEQPPPPKEVLQSPQPPTPVRKTASWNAPPPSPKTSGTQKAKSDVVRPSVERRNKVLPKPVKKGKDVKKKLAGSKEKRVGKVGGVKGPKGGSARVKKKTGRKKR